ncbi:MAG: PQQ-binding-like beta-propeller repeat protein, partial [Ktedonobacteraceae bacterium]
DPSTGNLRWKHTPGYFLEDPVINGDTIYGIGVQGIHGSLYALNGSDGSVIWQQPLADSGLYYSTLVIAGVLYCVGPGQSNDSLYSLYAFSLSKGDQLWRTRQSISGGESSNITFDRGMLYFSVDSHQLYAFKAQDGSLAWTRTFRATVSLFHGEMNNSVIPAANGQVYLVSQSVADASPLQVLALNSSTGATAWSQSAPQGANAFQVLIAGHDRLYLGAAESLPNRSEYQVSIFVFNTTTGKLSTSYPTPVNADSDHAKNFILTS